MILITRLLGTKTTITDYWATGAPHAILMNTGFLMSTTLILIITIIDKSAFSSLLTVISNEANYIDKAKVISDLS